MNISTDRCNIHYTQPKIHWCNGFAIYIKQILTLFFLNLLIFSFNAVGQLSTNNNADKWIAFNLNSILYNGQHAGVAHAEITNHVPNEWNTIQTGTLVSNSNVQFTLDAMNPIRSLVFNTKFAPPEAADLDQLRNGGIGEPPTPNNWVNGNAGPENSHFIESWSIPYRMRISGLTNNTSHNIIIEWDIMGSSGTKHAIDYITHFQNLGSNTLHNSLFGHNAEVVNPGFGLTVSSTNTWPIPEPSSAGSPVAGQPTTSFNALNLKDFTIYNGTITAMSYVSQGDLTADGSKTRLSITFTANFSGGANTVILGWGGHIASQSDWGIGESASDINGSPYHTRLIELDGSGGNQDRSLKADAVVVPPGCNITSPDLCPLTTSSTATAGLTNAAGVTTSYTWSLTGTNTANATLTGSTSGSVASGVTTIPGVGISAPAGGFAAGTSFTVQLSVSRTFSGIVFSSICTKTVNITTGATATATANPTAIDIRTAAHNTTLNVSVTPGNISDYDLLWTEDGAGSLNFNNVASPVYTAVPADQAQTINFNVTLTPKAGTTGLCPNNAQVSVPVNGTATCLVSCLTNCSPCAGSVSTFRGPLNDPVGSNTFYDWNITSGDASITGADNGQEVTVTAGLTNYRLELTITYSNTALNQAPCGIDVTVGDVQANAVPTHALCFGGNGSVNLTVSGGTAPYSFLWNTGATTEDLASVPAGAYSVTVTDANGCTETANATVNQPTDVTANAVPTHALCFGGNGSVNLTVGGGTPPYTFLWNTGATTEDLASVPAGAYSVTVTDANGCTETANATVNQPTDVTANAVPTHALCFGGNGSVNLTVGGGTPPYTFLWNTGATTEDLASVPAG
ncbi:hypothetical protein, partial [Lacibacter sp. H407]|uniref:hypothetical protein n=1 Tax=Lacibacter sp. H407 TaxID=3133423 RepID=UPI0030C25B7F